jgi:hypothetical protein
LRSLFYFYFSCILAAPEAGSNRECIVILACTEAIIIAMLAPLYLIWLGATTRTVLVPGCGGMGVMGVYGGDACPAPRAGVHSEGLATSRTPLYLGYGGERRPEAAVRHGATTRRRGPVRKCSKKVMRGIFLATTDSRTSSWYGRIALTTMRTAWCPFMPQKDQPRPFGPSEFGTSK